LGGIRCLEQSSKIGSGQDTAGQRKTGVIEDIEKFGAKLRVDALSDLGVFQDREVEVGKALSCRGLEEKR